MRSSCSVSEGKFISKLQNPGEGKLLAVKALFYSRENFISPSGVVDRAFASLSVNMGSILLLGDTRLKKCQSVRKG